MCTRFAVFEAPRFSIDDLMFDFMNLYYAGTQQAGSSSGKQTSCLCRCVAFDVHKPPFQPEHLKCPGLSILDSPGFLTALTMRFVLEHCVFGTLPKCHHQTECVETNLPVTYTYVHTFCMHHAW